MRRFGGGALANSLSQTSTTRAASFLWNCTHSETVSMLACVELSLSSFSVSLAGLKAMAIWPLQEAHAANSDAAARLSAGNKNSPVRTQQGGKGADVLFDYTLQARTGVLADTRANAACRTAARTCSMAVPATRGPSSV